MDARKRTLTIALVLLAGCGGSSSDDGGGAGNGGSGNGGGSGGGGSGGGTTNDLLGLDTRPQNLTCAAPDRNASGDAGVELAVPFPDLPALSNPLAMAQVPGDDGRWFVVEQGGRVRVFDNEAGVNSFNTDFINMGSFLAQFVTGGESGLLGMAFHPDFASNAYVYLSWTEGNPLVSVVARFESLDGGQTLDPTTRLDIIRINQDFSNHNGGHIAFGPDGYLYIGMGDGGSGGDPNSRAQDTNNLLGAMLRLDVDTAEPYAIPPTNPFAANAMCPADHSSAASCPEIYAWGLRNPWRWSFDRATDALWLGDVGQNAREEIDIVTLGGNYGWDCREGFNAYSQPAAQCAANPPLVEPVHDYGHANGDVSVTGGYVYRGSGVPELVGNYVFADFATGRIWRLEDDGSGGYEDELLLESGLSIASFAEGLDGEIFLTAFGAGIRKIVPAAGGGGGSAPVASLLSQTGCFSAADPAQPADGMIAYDVAAPFWSDNAVKERWLAIPDGSTVDTDADGDFLFPAGSVLAKHFRLNGELIETRLFMRHPDGEWAGYSYEWNDTASDATLVEGGKSVDIDGQRWVYPDGAQCLRCHTPAAGYSLGLEYSQLNNDLEYPSTGRSANQLETLAGVAVLTSPIADASVHPSLPDPFGNEGSVDERARAYLHTNCAQCHRPGGPTPSAIDLRSSTQLSLTGTCNAAPQEGDLGIANALIVAPGEPDRSVLLERMNRRDALGEMPPLASNEIDAEGVALIRDWIAGLASC